MNKQQVTIGVADVLQIIFIVLKVLGLIDWPWVWVLAPIWISLIVVAVTFALDYIVHRHRFK